MVYAGSVCTRVHSIVITVSIGTWGLDVSKNGHLAAVALLTV